MTIQQINEMLDSPADYVGECDECHDDQPLTIDHNEPGEFAFCRACLLKMKKKEKARLAKKV